MKSIIQHEKYGPIIYDESFWTGKKSITIDGTPLDKMSKTQFTYRLADGSISTVKVKGSFLTGVKLTIDGEEVQVIEPPKWYEVVFAVLTFMLVMIWGNVPALCEIIPIVGGALGGLITAACIVAGFTLSRRTKSVLLKLLISVGVLVATFALCFLAALLLLSALA